MKFTKSLFSILTLVLITAVTFPISSTSAELSTTPSFVTSELWSDYKQLTLFEADGAKRNLKWVTSPGYFVKGTPKSSDIDALNNVISTIAKSCDTLLPGRSTQEPGEGVIFNFIPRSEFKSVISSTPDDVTNSYLHWTYYLNRGITKTQVVISSELADIRERNRLIRIRALQGFGFYSLSTGSDYTFLSNSYSWETSPTLSRKDKELLSFFCSSLTRAWDTDLQTQNYLNSFNVSVGNVLPSVQHRVNVGVTNYGVTVDLQPRGDLSISQGVREILVVLSDSQGSEITRQVIDLSKDSFSIRNFVFGNLKAKSGYSLTVYSKNNAGYGTPKSYDFRTQEITSKPPTSNSPATDASLEALDAYNAALDAYNLVLQAKLDCVRAFQGSSTVNNRILNLVSGNQICNSQDSLLKAAYQRLLLLDPDKLNIKVSASSIDEMNEITNQFDIFAEVMDEGIVFAEELRDSANALRTVEALIEVLESYSSSVDTVLERLPSKIKNSLYLKPEIASFISLHNEYLKTSEEFKGALSEFSGLSYVDFEALEDFKRSIDLASRLLPSEASVDDAQINALKVIPSFYCKKGKVLSLPSKGKCSFGARKVKIDKTW